MYRKRQTQGFLQKSFDRRGDFKESKSPTLRKSQIRKNMNSTEKMKTRVSIDYTKNEAVKPIDEPESCFDKFDESFQQTNEQPFLDLKIVHQHSPSADNAKSQRGLEATRLVDDSEFDIDQSRDLVFADQVLPNNIHDQTQTNRSSQYQFKTPKAEYDDDTDFRGSCAKQIPVARFEESNLEGARQIEPELRKKSGVNQAFHNYKNSFQSFDNDIVYDKYNSMGITSGSNEKDKERVILTEASIAINNSSMFSPTALAMEQTLQSSYQCNDQNIEPEMTQQDELDNQPLSLEINQKQSLRLEFKDAQDVKIDHNDEEDDELQAPNSAGFQQYNSVNKKTGTLISIGRQSNLVNNILSAGSYSKKKNNSSISKGRTPIHEKQFNTASRQTLKIQKFELGLASSHKRNTTAQVNNYTTTCYNNIEKVTQGLDIYKSFQDKKKQPMEPMIIQRSSIVMPIKGNYNTTTNSQKATSISRGPTKTSTRRSGKTDNLQLSSKRGSSRMAMGENKKPNHQTSQSVSFTGLSSDQMNRRKQSISKDPFTKQQQQRQMLVKKQNSITKQSFSKNKVIDGQYLSVNSQKTSSRYNFSSSVKAQSNEVSMQNLKLGMQNSNNQSLLKDMNSVRSGVKQRLNTGISDYVKQLKQNDKKIIDNVYKDAYVSVHNRNKTKTSFQSCHSRSISHESKYSRLSKRESRRSSKATKAVVVPQQDSQKTRLSQLKQKYNGLNRLGCGSRMSVCKLNSSVQSLHSVLSRANSHQVSKKELEKFTQSRNEPSSQQVSLSNKLQATNQSFDQKSEGNTSTHVISYNNIKPLSRQDRHQTKSVNYQGSFKNIKTVHSAVQLLRNSISITAKNTQGTFEDVVLAQQKKAAEIAKIEKMNEAKKKANNYLRRGPSKSKVQSTPDSVNHQSSTASIVNQNRCSVRVNQQKVIQEKLFERYHISSNQNSTQKVDKNQPQIYLEENHNDSFDIQVVKTPERKKSERVSSVTPDQKQSYQRFTRSVKLINQKFGAVLKGYKIRRLFHNHQSVKDNRVQFRDLVQFVFFLQEEINDINQKLEIMGEDSILTSEHNYAKQYLGQALEEIISIRSRFQEEFYELLEDNSWMNQTQAQIVPMNYKQGSKFNMIKNDYTQDICRLLAHKKEQDNQARLQQLGLAESQRQNKQKIYRTTVISTINDLNTMEEEDDDIVQEMERHLNCSQQVYPVKKQSLSPEEKEFRQKERSQPIKMCIVENETENNCFSPPQELSSTLKNNLKSLTSDQQVFEPKILIQENDKSEDVTPNLSQYHTVNQTPINRSPIAQKQYPETQSPVMSPQHMTPQAQEQMVNYSNFNSSPDQQSPEFVSKNNTIPEFEPCQLSPKQQPKKVSPKQQPVTISTKSCLKDLKNQQFQKQLSPQKRPVSKELSPQKRPVSSPQKVQRLIQSMITTPKKFESKIPRCTSNSNSKVPRVYREAFSKSNSKIPRSRHTRNSSVMSNSNTKSRPEIPILNLSKICMYQEGESPLPMVDQVPAAADQHFKSVVVDLQEEPSFEIKLENIKKKSMDVKKNAEISFNNSTNFEKCGGLKQIQEETTQGLLQELSFLDDEKDDKSESCINPMQVCDTESVVEDQQNTIFVDDIQLQQNPKHMASIFSTSNCNSNSNSFIDSQKQVSAQFQEQFNKRRNSKEKMGKSAKQNGINSSQKKTVKKKVSPMKENSPYKVSKFNNMNTISTENLNLRASDLNENSSPLKEKDIQTLEKQYASVPVSGANQRRPRNQRSKDQSAQKPKVRALEPFKDQTEAYGACVNSPVINIPEQSEHYSSNGASKQSQDQLINQVGQIQQMIVNLQKQKSESAASSNGQVFDDAYKQQFEQMLNGLKTQFDALTK